MTNNVVLPILTTSTISYSFLLNYILTPPFKKKYMHLFNPMNIPSFLLLNNLKYGTKRIILLGYNLFTNIHIINYIIISNIGRKINKITIRSNHFKSWNRFNFCNRTEFIISIFHIFDIDCTKRHYL